MKASVLNTIWDMYADGKTQLEISETTGVSKSTVGRILRNDREEVGKPSRGNTNTDFQFYQHNLPAVREDLNIRITLAACNKFLRDRGLL